MSAGFVVALVVGFEGTLYEVLSRQLSAELRAAVMDLLARVATARDAIEEIDAKAHIPCTGK